MIQESEWALWTREISFAQLGEVNQVNHMFYYYRTHCFQELHLPFGSLYLQIQSENFLILKIIQEDIIIMYTCLYI